MRLINYFPESSISVIHSAKDWQEAIDFSMASLLDKNYISENYIQAIKDSTMSNGPYYILAPGVAMPHARPECGALKEGANKRGNSSRLTQSFHFFMFEPIFSPVNALNQPI